GGRYVDDVRLARRVGGGFVRSPHAHARIVGIDIHDARRAPGVTCVLVGADTARLCKPYRGILEHYRGMKTGAMLPLATDRVRYVGEPVAAVAAETRAQAEDAAARVVARYDPLRAVLSPDAALAPGAPLIHDELADNLIYATELATGEVDGAGARAYRTYRRMFTTGRHTGVPMEPRGLVADFDPATRALTVWISTQVPHMMQAVGAEFFCLSRTQGGGVVHHLVRTLRLEFHM